MKKPLESDRYVTQDGLIVHVGFVDALSSAGVTDLTSLQELDAGHDLHKPSLASWRRRTMLRLPDGKRSPIFVKHYTRPPLMAQLKRVLSGSIAHGTAWIEWRRMDQLAECGIAAARPVAFGERLIGPWERYSVVAMASVPGESLERWAKPHLQPGKPTLQLTGRRRLADALAHFVARFHKAGFVHRDLYFSHIFVDRHDTPEPVFHLIDLQRVFQPGWRRRRWVIKDLASLNYSTLDTCLTNADRIRWLKTYLGISKLTHRHKALCRAIAAKTRRIVAHDRRRPSKRAKMS